MVLFLALTGACSEALDNLWDPSLGSSDDGRMTSERFHLEGAKIVTANTSDTLVLSVGSLQCPVQVRVHLILVTPSRQGGAIIRPFYN